MVGLSPNTQIKTRYIWKSTDQRKLPK